MRRVALLTALLAAGCDASADGARAYREGRFKDAAAELSRAAKDAGDGAPAELVYDAALASLRAGDLAAAESSAQAAGKRGGEFAALADFVRGNASYARSALSETQADRPESEPFAFDVAIKQAETARDAWARAAVTRDAWPEARRNVERALIAIERLTAKKLARQNQPKKSAEQNKPLPLPQPKVDPKDKKETAADVEVADLSADEVRRLFDVLAAKEKEKRETRRTRRDIKGAEVERDW
jgi:hypothetical protein